jgi:hypothetical protein
MDLDSYNRAQLDSDEDEEYGSVCAKCHNPITTTYQIPRKKGKGTKHDRSLCLQVAVLYVYIVQETLPTVFRLQRVFFERTRRREI